mgnify:FL=1|tara:strand:- start:36 stop:665 length:630 start_codon:yes stop_codon:yes gene_type:complete
MAKKKLLSETQVRRFMGLAGIQPINEMGNHSPAGRDDKMEFEEEEEEMMGDIEPVVDDEVVDDEMDVEEVPSDEAEMDSESLLDIKDKLEDVLSKLTPLFDAAGAGDEEAEFEDEEVDMGMEDEEVVDDEVGFEEEEEEPVLEGIKLQLSQTEIVNEVARRVAKRIVTAKRAQQRMNEALGRKSPAKRKPAVKRKTAVKRSPAKRRRNK